MHNIDRNKGSFRVCKCLKRVKEKVLQRAVLPVRNLNLIQNFNVRLKFILTLAFGQMRSHSDARLYESIIENTCIILTRCPEIWSYSTLAWESIQDVCHISKSTVRFPAQGQGTHSTCSFPQCHDSVSPMSRRNSKYDCSPSLSFLPGES